MTDFLAADLFRGLSLAETHCNCRCLFLGKYLVFDIFHGLSLAFSAVSTVAHETPKGINWAERLPAPRAFFNFPSLFESVDNNKPRSKVRTSYHLLHSVTHARKYVRGCMRETCCGLVHTFSRFPSGCAELFGFFQCAKPEYYDGPAASRPEGCATFPKLFGSVILIRPSEQAV